MAWNKSSNEPITGDADNLTIYLAIDGVSVAATNTPSEIDAVHLPGLYKILLTASEMNCDSIGVGGTSITSNVIIIPVLLMTESGIISEISESVGVGDNFISWTYTLRSSEDDSPIPECRVAVYSDPSKTNIVGLGYTDSFGNVSFNLQSGTYYIWRSKSGFLFDNPDIEVVS